MNLSNFSFFFLNFFKHFSWHLVIFPIELVITSDSSFFSSINFMTSTFPAEDSLSLFGVTTRKYIWRSLKRKNKKSRSHIINMPVGWISTYCLLRSRPLSYSCLFSLYGFVACWSLGPLACLVASALLVACLDATVLGVHPSDFWHVCRMPFFSLLSLHVRVSCVSLFMCLITCLPFPFVW